MNTLSPDLQKRLCYILHLGLVEARSLGLSENSGQVSDLADALENMPRYLFDWKEECLEAIRSDLRTYQEKYPQATFDYLKYLEEEAPPERF